MKIKFTFLFLLLSLSFSFAQTIRYVKPVASGTGSGSNWANASSNLEARINDSGANDQIWLAEGTCKPTTGTVGSISFSMKNGVASYGGFSNTGNPVMADRNWAIIPSILNGDLNGNDIITGSGANLRFTNNWKNSFHGIFNFSKNNILLDGFTVSGGNASVNSGFNHSGGGIYYGSSALSLNNIIFSGNSPLSSGDEHYSFAFFDGPNFTLVAVPQASYVFSTITPAAGAPTHTISVTDTFNNTSTSTITINPPSALTVVTICKKISSFARTQFNIYLSLWNVSSVSSKNNMFSYATHFNQDISLWNVSNVTFFYLMFGNATDFNQNLSFPPIITNTRSTNCDS